MPDDIDRAQDALLDGAEKALRIIADDLMGRAQRRAPIDEGTLRGSAYVDVDRTRTEVKARVGFPTPYARRQHEELDYEHPGGGEAKFLERPLLEMTPRYTAAIAAAAEREMRRL